MTTILILSPKGGSGKSTLARTIAAAAAGDGLNVTTLDTDSQGTLARWHRKRSDIEGIPRIDGRSVEIAHAAPIARSQGLMIVDTPTAIEAYPEAVRDLIMVSDMVLIPSQPLPDDVDSVETAMRSVIALRKRALYVLNRVRVGIKEVDGSRMRLARTGDVAATAIPDSVVIVRAMNSGYGPTEVSGRGSEESGALWAEVRRRCEL